MTDTQNLLKSLFGTADLAKLSQNVNQSTTIANEYLEKINNVLLMQETFDTFPMTERHPMLEFFMGEYGLDVADGKQLLENLLINSIDYNADEILPSKRELADTISAYAQTEVKRLFELSLSMEIVKRAFTSIPRFDQFIANYKGQLDKSYYNELWNLIQYYFIPNTPTAYYFDGSKVQGGAEFTDIQQAVQEFSGIMESATGVPTRQFNLDGRKRKMNLAESWSEFCLIAHPKTINDLVTKNLPKLFNERFLDVTGTKFEKVIKSPLIPQNTLYVLHKDCFKLLKRLEKLENQYFPKALAIYNFLHFWLIPQFLPWGMAFRFVFDTVNDKNTLVAANSPKTAPVVVASGDNMNITGITAQATWNTSLTGDYVPTVNDYIVGRVINTKGDVLKEIIFNKTGDSTGAKWRFSVENQAVTVYAVIPKITANVATEFPIGDLANVPKGLYTVQLFTYLDGTRSSSNEYVVDATVPSVTKK